MDAVFTRQSLLDQASLRRLSRRSDLRGAAQFASHLAALGASATLVAHALGTVWLLPAWLVHGVLLNFLFCGLHESIHNTAMRSRAGNRLVAWCCGFAVNLPPRYFRCFHFDHHRYTQDPARDPELAGQPAKPGLSLAYLAWLVALKRVWWNELRNRLRHARGQVTENFIAASARAEVTREARVFVALYAAIAGASLWFASAAALYYWLVPLLLGRPFLSAYLMAEHDGCALNTDDMFANTRTTLSNPAVRWLAWNMPYHVEHHVFPGVPFHALPALYRRLRGRHRHLSPGYLAWHRERLAGRRPLSSDV